MNLPCLTLCHCWRHQDNSGPSSRNIPDPVCFWCYKEMNSTDIIQSTRQERGGGIMWGGLRGVLRHILSVHLRTTYLYMSVFLLHWHIILIVHWYHYFAHIIPVDHYYFSHTEHLDRDNILISHKMISLLSDQMQAINPLLFSIPDKTDARGTAVFPTGASSPWQ